jgi:enamine deaminase RidA (YjgF/YER057c/UK114 family)
MSEIERRDTGPLMSQVVMHGDTVYLAGQVSKEAADVKGQTAAILANIDTHLENCGSDKARILSATIYLTDISKFGEMNDAWSGWAVKGSLPARTTVEAKLAFPEFLVEITVVAAL